MKMVQKMMKSGIGWGLALSLSTSMTLVAMAQVAKAADANPAKPAPTDAEIAHIVVTANAIDVEAGKLAISKTKSAEVKKFAQQMVTDHTAVNKQASDLAKKLGVTPQANDVSASLRKGAEENVSNLKKLRGADFDRQYVDHEVAYHEAVLGAIDNTLVPNAKNEELKTLIKKVRPAIQAHLDHAKGLQSALNSSGAK